MERFRPDSWLAALLRPLLLADPEAYLYVEMSAPDGRFAFLLALLVVALCMRRGRLGLTSVQSRGLLALAAVFYLWVFVSGNGRYFFPGLILVGPLIVVVASRIPSSTTFRMLLLVMCAVLQSLVVADFYRGNLWGVARWYEGTAVPLASSPIRFTPAVFLKISGNSYSALVPYFHPESRWAMLGGHFKILPGSVQDAELQRMLTSPLPRYAMAVKDGDVADERDQPREDIRQFMSAVLKPFQLALSNGDCLIVPATNSAKQRVDRTWVGGVEGFWFCPVSKLASGAATAATPTIVPSDRLTIFEVFERSCPRFFSPGGGLDSHHDGVSRRLYSGTDIRIQVASDDTVYYQYFRSPNFTLVGKAELIRRGDLTVPCNRLVGRYQPPWER